MANKLLSSEKIIIDSVFLEYKLNYSLHDLLNTKSLLVAFELSQILGLHIKKGSVSCSIKNKPVSIKEYYWCVLGSRRINPIMEEYNQIQNIRIMSAYFPTPQEVTQLIVNQYKYCLKCYLDYEN